MKMIKIKYTLTGFCILPAIYKVSQLYKSFFKFSVEITPYLIF